MAFQPSRLSAFAISTFSSLGLSLLTLSPHPPVIISCLETSLRQEEEEASGQAEEEVMQVELVLADGGR